MSRVFQVSGFKSHEVQTLRAGIRTLGGDFLEVSLEEWIERRSDSRA